MANKKTKKLNIVLFICLAMLIVIAFLSVLFGSNFKHTLFSSSSLRAEAAGNSTQMASYGVRNFESYYGYDNYKTPRVHSPITVSQVGTNVSANPSGTNVGIYTSSTDSSQDPIIGVFNTSAKNYRLIQYVKFDLSADLQAVMALGNISKITVTVGGAYVAATAFVADGGTGYVDGFVALVPQTNNSWISTTQPSAQRITQQLPQVSGQLKKNTINHGSHTLTFNREDKFKYTKSIIVGVICVANTKSVLGMSPAVTFGAMTTATVNFTYQAPQVKIVDLTSAEKNAGMSLTVSNLTKGGTVSIGYGTSNYSVAVLTAWSGTTSRIFSKFDYGYTRANASDSFQNNPTQISVSSTSPNFTFTFKSLTAGTHTIQITSLAARVGNNGTDFLYQQDSSSNYRSKRQGPFVEVEETVGAWKKIMTFAGNEATDPDTPSSGEISGGYKIRNGASSTALFSGSGSYSSPLRPNNVGSYSLKFNILHKDGNTTYLSAIFTVPFTITAVPLNAGQSYFDEGTLGGFSYTYNGREHKPSPTSIIFHYILGNVNLDYKLTAGTDYLQNDFIYERNVRAYTGSVAENTAPKLTVIGRGNFQASNSIGFNIARLNIGSDINNLAIKQIGERAVDAQNNYLPVSQEITALWQTQIYNRNLSDKQFPKPDVSYLRFGWSTFEDGKTPAERLFLVSDYYSRDYGSFTENVSYDGKTFNKYRALSAATVNDSNPETSANWAIAAEYNINYNTYDQFIDGNKIYGCFTITIKGNQNILSTTIKIKYELAPRNLESANIYVEKYDQNLVYNGNKLSFTPAQINFREENVRVWEDYYDDATGTYKYAINSNASLTYKIVPNTIPYAEGISGFYSTSAVATGGNTNVSDNLPSNHPQQDSNGLYDGKYYYKNGAAPPSGNYIVFNVVVSTQQPSGTGASYLNFMFYGNLKIHFDISPKPLGVGTQTQIYSSNDIKPSDVMYNGAALEVPYLTVSDAGKILAVGIDYEVAYNNNINVSLDENGDELSGAEIIVSGKGNYGSEKSAYFKILRRNVSNALLNKVVVPAETYTGYVITPNIVQFSMKFNSSFLPDGTVNADIPDPLFEETFVVSNSNFGIKGLGDEVSGANINASSLDFNWITIVFTSGNFRGELKVNFEISPKNLSDASIEGVGRWHLMGSSERNSVTYRAAAIQNLIIRANESVDEQNTIIMKDENRSTNLREGSQGASNTDFYINPSTSWGVNINAGDEAGELTVYGTGNYAGSYTIKFKILARDISTSQDIVTITDTTAEAGYVDGQGYRYTGQRIEPSIIEVRNYGFAGYPVLVANEDYTVSYIDPGESDPYNNGYNISVIKGGRIFLEGIGNYIGKKTYSFNIIPKSQTVTLVSLTEIPAGNPNSLRAETIATNQAHFEVKGNEGSIFVYGKTDAIYPTARKVKFRLLDPITGQPSTLALESRIDYISCEVINNSYSLTKAEIKFEAGKYGIVKIVAEQEDGVGSISSNEERKQDGIVGIEYYYMYGNYNSFSIAKGSNINPLNLYIKREDSADGLSNIQKVYGNDVFSITHRLQSATVVSGDPRNSDFDIIIGDTSIVSFAEYVRGADQFKLYIENASVAPTTLEIRHNGYIHPTDVSKSYVAFSKVVSVDVAQRDLEISFEPLTVQYGTIRDEIMASIVYRFVTSAAGDNYDRLTYGGGRTDYPNEIITGLSINYSDNPHQNVGTHTINVLRSGASGQGTKFRNYNIKYLDGDGSKLYPGELTVSPKILNVYVKIKDVYGQGLSTFEKTYGNENPKNGIDVDTAIVGEYYFEYEGFISGENYAAHLRNDPSFVRPAIEFIHKNVPIDDPGYDEADGILIGDLTGAGIYWIKVTEGYSNNYIIPARALQMVINKAEVGIELNDISVDYTGNEYNVPIPIYDGNELVDYFSPIAIGVPNDLVGPIGADNIDYFTFQYIHDGEVIPKNAAPVNAGTHTVVITFHPVANDNYMLTTVTNVNNKIVIKKVKPIVSMASKTEIEFLGRPLTINNLVARALVSKIPGGSDPSPDNIPAANYEFKKSNESSSRYTSNWPEDMAVYDIRITYEANERSNYTNSTVEFIGILEITARSVFITASTYNYTFYGNVVVYPIANIYGYTNSTLEEELDAKPNGITIKYYKDNVHIATHPSGPINAGVYDIEVIFEPESLNFKETTRTFQGYFTIEKFDLHATNFDSALDYPDGQKVVAYNGTSHAFPRNLITIKQAEQDNTPIPAAQILVEYRQEGQSDYISSPKNAGTYELRIRYIPVENDNYIMAQHIVYPSIIKIEQISPSFNEVEQKNVVFTGRGQSINADARGISYAENGQSKTDILTGTLEYKYRQSNTGDAFSSTLPVIVGTYDVRVGYTQSVGDNYKSSERVYTAVLRIGKATPKLKIFGNVNLIVVEFMGEVSPVVVVEGVSLLYQPDVSDDAVTIVYKKGEVVVENPSSESGMYGIYAQYNSMDNNYVSVPNTKICDLKVKNIGPILSLESLQQTYDGFEVEANQVIVENNEDNKEMKGTFLYFYKRSSTIDEYSLNKPINAGSYDVKVEYIEKDGDDNFSSVSTEFRNAIVIVPLEIEIEPIYGQGKIFDGTIPDFANLLYYYKYIDADGDRKTVYPEVKDSYGFTYDLSSAIYYGVDGLGYKVVLDSKEVHQLYNVYQATPSKASFSYLAAGGQAPYVENLLIDSNDKIFSIIGNNISRAFIIDLQNNLAYTRNENVDYFETTTRTGFFVNFFSSHGVLETIRIYPENITPVGTYVITIDGRQKTYRVNLDNMKLEDISTGQEYSIFTSAGEIKLPRSDGGYDAIYVDYNQLIKGESPTPMYLFYAKDGFVYNVMKEQQKSKRMFKLNVSEFKVSLDGVNFVYIKTSDLTHSYGSIYTFVYESKAYEYDLENSCVREDNIELFVGVLNTEENKIEFHNDQSLDIQADQLIFKLHRQLEQKEGRLFNMNTQVKMPALININDSWEEQNAAVFLQNAGSEKIDLSSVKANGNYDLSISSNVVNYLISKTIVYVNFDGSNSIYNEYDKYISYEFVGLALGAQIDLFEIDSEYEGDRTNVTGEDQDGYRLKISIDNSNYYIYGGIVYSPWFSIAPAKMAKYTQPEIFQVYSGKPYKLDVSGLDSTYEIKYIGYDTAPSFEIPGRYIVDVVISKQNYLDETASIMMTINKALYTAKPSKLTQTLYYGDDLPILDSTELGDFYLLATQKLDPTVSTYIWKFRPKTEDFYLLYEGLEENDYLVEGTMEIDVERISVPIQVEGSLKQSLKNPTSLIPTLDGKPINIEGLTIVYKDASGQTYLTMPTKPGKYRLVVSYSGDEYTMPQQFEEELTIVDSPNLTWVWITLGAIGSLMILSSIYLLLRKKKIK